MRTVARLDYDSREQLRDGIARLRFLRDVLKENGSYAGPAALKRWRTRRGWHVELMAEAKLTPAQAVALQAILGSDYRRETFNLVRVLRLPVAPGFWQRFGHWNVLHGERIV